MDDLSRVVIDAGRDSPHAASSCQSPDGGSRDPVKNALSLMSLLSSSSLSFFSGHFYNASFVRVNF